MPHKPSLCSIHCGLSQWLVALINLSGAIEMDQAICTEDGVIYTATNFSRLHPEDLARKRQLLHCIEYSVIAFF
jgi:hypothetical protein